jgi:benzoate/toluate 1,2-dioxygenase reductase subunit
MATTADRFKSVIIQRHWLSGRVFEIKISRPPRFKYESGQWIRIFAAGSQRDYTLISSPKDQDLILCIRHVEGGQLSHLLGSAELGTQISFTGPGGYFTYKSSEHPAVFVATGTGIAPFCSMARSGANGFTMLHGVDDPLELHYKSVIEPVADLYVPCNSGSQNNQGDFFGGRVTDYMQNHLDRKVYDFYLCGQREMIRDMLFLIDEYFSNSLVYTETFY